MILRVTADAGANSDAGDYYRWEYRLMMMLQIIDDAESYCYS